MLIFRVVLVTSLSALLVSCSGGSGSSNVVVVTDLVPGPVGSEPGSMIDFNGVLYFDADTPDFGRELWRTDGTTTELVVDIKPGPDFSSPRDLVVAGDRLYFTAGYVTRELWVTDRVTTARIGKQEGIRDPEHLTDFNGVLVFSADTVFFGRELWFFDGQSLTMATDINPLAGDSNPYTITPVGNELYFGASDGVRTGQGYVIHGFGLSKIADPQPFPSGYGITGNFHALGGTIFFGAIDDAHGWELWRLDGGVPVLDSEINPGPAILGLLPWTMMDYDGLLVFVGFDEEHGFQLWAHDGSSATRLTDSGEGDDGAFPADLTVVDGDLYFSALSTGYGRELWRFDGTGVRAMGDLSPGPDGSEPWGFVKFGDRIYFSARTPFTGRELWFLEGNRMGLAADFMPGRSDGLFSSPVISGGRLFVVAAGPDTGREIYTIVVED